MRYFTPPAGENSTIDRTRSGCATPMAATAEQPTQPPMRCAESTPRASSSPTPWRT